MYEETKRSVDVYSAGCQTRPNGLGRLVGILLVAPSSLARTASDARLTTEPKISGGELGRYASNSFEYKFRVCGKVLPQ